MKNNFKNELLKVGVIVDVLVVHDICCLENKKLGKKAALWWNLDLNLFLISNMEHLGYIINYSLITSKINCAFKK